MTTAHVYIAASLDGYIVREDGDIGWLMPKGADTEDHGYDAFIDAMDGIVMGRGTWEKVLTFGPWPFAKPVVVMSKTLREEDLPSDQHGKVRVWNCTPAAVLERLKHEGWLRAYIDGGQLIQSFLRHGLVADIVVTRAPVILGAGRNLFGPLDSSIPLQHLQTECFGSGLVQSRYRVAH